VLTAERPETDYAWNGDVALAYQVFGGGAVDLVYVQGYASHVDLNWESPYLARFLRGLAKHTRVIMTDRRGWGCSDRFSPGDVAPLEIQVDDVRVVMDAAASERALIFGSWETALTAMLFAAGSPERTAGLILSDPFVSYIATPQTPWMWSQAEWDRIKADVRRAWGKPEYRRNAGDFADEREFLEWFVPWMRASIAPGALAAEFDRFSSIDVTGVLPSIQVPTLVVSGPDDAMRRNAAAIAESIPMARLIEPGSTNDTGWFHWYGRGPAIVDAIGALAEQVREEQRVFDRVLATVLFTDIVGSSDRASELGDRRWAALLERHHAVVRALLARYRGVEVDTAGDGFFATFDGPARAVSCARAMMNAVRALGLEIRAGVHTGEVQTIDGKVGGIGVVIGARIGALAGASEVLVSPTVKELTVGSGLVFEDAGEHELKGVPDRWHLFRIAGEQT
jgi:class 3 adenylate cyclase/pimeloyl-ACP methyl ester carboxylesterase